MNNEAHNLIHNAIKEGKIIRPDKCSSCNKTCKPDGHHADYDNPLEVIWLCRLCHRFIHKIVGKGKNHNGRFGYQQIPTIIQTECGTIFKNLFRKWVELAGFRSISDAIRTIVRDCIAGRIKYESGILKVGRVKYESGKLTED